MACLVWAKLLSRQLWRMILRYATASPMAFCGQGWDQPQIRKASFRDGAVSSLLVHMVWVRQTVVKYGHAHYANSLVNVNCSLCSMMPGISRMRWHSKWE